MVWFIDFFADWFPSTSFPEGGLVLKGIGRAIIPEVIEDEEGESSAGQEPATATTTTNTPPALNPDPSIQTESTAF